MEKVKFAMTAEFAEYVEKLEAQLAKIASLEYCAVTGCINTATAEDCRRCSK